MATEFVVAIWAAVATLAMAMAGLVAQELNASATAINWCWTWTSAFAGTMLTALVANTINNS